MCTSRTPAMQHPGSYCFGYGSWPGWDTTSSCMEGAEEGGKQVGAEMGGLPRGRLPPACSRAGRLQRKGLKYLLVHLSVGGLLLPSCLRPYCSPCLVGEKGIFLRGEPWLQPGAEQGPPGDEFSLPPPAFHLPPPLAGARSRAWVL